MKKIVALFLIILPATLLAQNKKPIDHSVYDNWQAIGEKKISNNGKYVVYAVNPQEGDGNLVIQETSGKVVAEISRGYNATITDDNQFVVFKIKPWYKETREAKIKKKKADEQPKDSLGILRLSDGELKLYPRIKSFQTPEKGSGWVVMLAEKPEETKKDSAAAKSKKTDMRTDNFLDADDEKPGDSKKDEGGDLIIRNLLTGEENVVKNVTEYILNKTGKKLAIETGVPKKDTLTKPAIIIYDLASGTHKPVMNNLNEAKAFSFDEEGNQLAFVAERDSATKAVQKFYKLWYYKDGSDSAVLLADRNTRGVRWNWTISENAKINFSKSGKRLMFGTAVILPPKDTTLPEMDRVSVDIWNYKDDQLQPQQLKNRDREEKKNYMALYDFKNNAVVQLENENITNVYATLEGDGENFYGVSDSGSRVNMQWQGFTVKSYFHINPETGKATRIIANQKGMTSPSYTGKYFLWYDEPGKKYFVYNANNKSITNISKSIPFPVYDEENDVPDDANPYGASKWLENDAAIFIQDRYDVWQVDPENPLKPINITGGVGRKNKTEYKILRLDEDEKYFKPGQTIFLSTLNTVNKGSGISKLTLGSGKMPEVIISENAKISNVNKSKDDELIVFTKETFKQSPNLYATKVSGISKQGQTQLTDINLQQSDYLWGTNELFTWKAYTGKETEGIIYKPENFDPKKKYPMIVYFYERNNETLNNYIAPAPTPSRLNITYFVSNGYVVFVPDIWYKTGYPGKSAYDYILSGTRAVVKQGYVDSTKIGLQGQSWGGYQIAHLITRTNLYAAAWAGAPVANMTSAYGGIRWGTGLNRQFQYEKTQSRIGATLWERPDLYIENSPLFHLPKVKTPLVIMANDADDAVPWYQGIELFTGLRRLGKPVWMLNYNNDLHNLVERKNRKDISIREQQFFDWKLKGAKPPVWLAEGVPAIMKGRTLGLEVE